MSERVILITGGTGKLGRVLVGHFLASGDVVVATGRSESSLEELRRAHPDAGTRLAGIAADLTAEGAAASILAQLDERGLSPEGLVNNARSLEFLKLDANGLVRRADFVGELLVDVVAPYELTMALARHPASRLRRVVNIGSQYGLVAANPALYGAPARQSPLHYGVAKAALAHLTRELAVRLADRGIQVNCVAFGGVEGRVDAAFRQRYAALCPQRRMLTEDEVAGPVDYLLSDRCSAITGHVMAADGGWSIW